MVAVLLAACACAARGPVIMAWDEYARRSVQWPYVLTFETTNGTLLYYGARHTYTPADTQVQQLEQAWACFRPTMAFNEGGNPPVETSRDAAVEKYGEAGLVRFLAARDDVPVASLDPDRAEEVAHLRKRFTPEQVKLFFLLRNAAQFADRRGAEGVDAELQRVLTIHNATPGLGVAPRTLPEVVAAFGERFPDADYRRTPLRWFDPMRSETFLNEVSRSDSEFRDRAMIAILERSIADGQRVFAVVGGTHVVMQERALADRIGRRASAGACGSN